MLIGLFRAGCVHRVGKEYVHRVGKEYVHCVGKEYVHRVGKEYRLYKENKIFEYRS